MTMSTLTLKEIINYLSSMDRTQNVQSIDLPQPIRNSIRDAIPFETLINILKKYSPSIKIDDIKEEESKLRMEVYELDYDCCGSWSEVKHFCFVPKNNNTFDVFGIDADQNVIFKFKGFNKPVEIQDKSYTIKKVISITDSFLIPIE